jgi:hypothetical protein
MTTEVQAPYQAPALASRMADAARRFLGSLDEEQRRTATFPFFGDERYKWNYRPMENMPRNGLWLMAMKDAQKQAAYALLETGCSASGVDKTHRIMQRETTLREHERLDGMITKLVRDPELFWWTVFGEPGGDEPWGWRVSGHHVGLHFTVVGDQIAPCPLFFGANPAESRYGADKGDRILPEEEDVARDLLTRLDEPRRALALYSPIAPRDIMTDINRRVWPGIVPRGLAYGRMESAHQRQLADLIRIYLNRAHDDLADAAWRRVESAGLDGITFAWAGPAERHQPHYYAVSGPTFMIEYDNVQNNANHIHSVWREWDGDWGEDILAEHYRNADQHHGHDHH